MTEHATTTSSSQEATSIKSQYPMPWAVRIKMVWAALWGKKRSFASDASACISSLDPPLKILGAENIPRHGPCLVIANHYSRPGFRAWWIALAISASLPFEVHWVMTNAWRFEGRHLATLLEALTRWGFHHVAQAYGFTTFPPMPPRDDEIEARAQAVRHLLRYARRVPNPVIGLVPEGYDMPDGVLGQPPAGVGRLVAHLIPYTQHILPVAVFEEGGCLILRFGKPYPIQIPTDRQPKDVDQRISEAVMCAIAGLLPSHLRGAYR